MHMKIKWQKVLGGIALASVLAGASTAAIADDWDFGTWDANDSGGVEYNEWSSNYPYEGIYSNWDANNDGFVDETEWGTGVYNSYDRNDDGWLDDDEFTSFNDDVDDGWLNY